MIEHYDWAGGREAMLRFGPDTGPVAIAALPLFEEANRTRAFAVSILRALAGRGIAGVLPELPGTGESLVPTEQATVAAMRRAYAAAVDRLRGTGRAAYGLAIRSGALLDPEAALSGRWRLAPQDGPDLLRELTRIRQLGPATASQASAEIAGNPVSADLLAELDMTSSAGASPQRIVRLVADPKPADRKFDAPPLWRLNEPDNNVTFAEELAIDIADWIATCGG